MKSKISETTAVNRRRSAIISAVIVTAFIAAQGALLLYLGIAHGPGGILNAAIVVVAILEFLGIIPVQITLKYRLSEIKGGEEDAAAQY